MKPLTTMAILAVVALSATAQNNTFHYVAGPRNAWDVRHDGARTTCTICHPNQQAKPSPEAKPEAKPATPAPPKPEETSPQQKNWKREEAERIKAEQRKKAEADSLAKCDPSNVAYHGAYHYRKISDTHTEVWVWDSQAKCYRNDSKAAKEVAKQRSKNRRRAEANHQRNIAKNTKVREQARNRQARQAKKASNPKKRK